MTDPIDPGTTVNQVVRRCPETLGVFRRFGIDTCCGGGATLERAAGEGGIEVATLLEALHAVAGEGDGETRAGTPGRLDGNHHHRTHGEMEE